MVKKLIVVIIGIDWVVHTLVVTGVLRAASEYPAGAVTIALVVCTVLLPVVFIPYKYWLKIPSYANVDIKLYRYNWYWHFQGMVVSKDKVEAHYLACLKKVSENSLGGKE